MLGYNLQPYLPQALMELSLFLSCMAVLNQVFMGSTARGSGSRLYDGCRYTSVCTGLLRLARACQRLRGCRNHLLLSSAAAALLAS